MRFFGSIKMIPSNQPQLEEPQLEGMLVSSSASDGNANSLTALSSKTSNNAATVAGIAVPHASANDNIYLNQKSYQIQLQLLHTLQHPTVRKISAIPFTILHYLFQSDVLIAMFIFCVCINYNLELMYIIGKGIAIANIVYMFMKYYWKAPRPIWIDQTLHLSKFVWETDYSFPSGHSALVGSIFSSSLCYYVYNEGYSFAGAMALPTVWSLLVITLMTAASRCVLGMHFISDVLCGLFIGIVTPVVWVLTGLDARYHELCDWNVGLGFVAGIASNLLVILGFLYFYVTINRDKEHLARVERWNLNVAQVVAVLFENAKDQKKFLIEPQKMHSFSLVMGGYVFNSLYDPIMGAFDSGNVLFNVRTGCVQDYALALTLGLSGVIAIGVVMEMLPKGHIWIAVRTVFVSALLFWVAIIQENYNC
ncbi:phosphatidic acid phosphatase type 2/haloperoxidase [Obelidium mucronatum]|nr:phosphatidic acid phosphatase type 2/haloperoxidase [Obelidium mucronatum]